MMNVDLNGILSHLLKYLFEGLVVAVACFLIPKKKLEINEVLMLALVAGSTFIVLDLFIPSMGESARTGAGFGIGANLVGFPGGL